MAFPLEAMAAMFSRAASMVRREPAPREAR